MYRVFEKHYIENNQLGKNISRKKEREREREREWERTEKHRNINKVMPKVQERDRE